MTRHPRSVVRRVGLALLVAAAALPVAPSVRASAPPRPQAAPFGSAKYVSVTPVRIAETRTTPGPPPGPYGFTRLSPNLIRIQVAGVKGVPANAVAAVLNVTAIDANQPGFVGVYPAGSTSGATSNLNIDQPGRVIANLVTVKLSAGGAVDIYHQNPLNLAVDVSGAYVPVNDPVVDGRLVTVAAGAIRVLDTRGAVPPIYPPKPAGSTTLVDLAPAGVPADASAVVITLTAVDGNAGFWSAYPAGVPWPGTSTLNLDRSPQTRAGQAIVPLTPGSRAINVYNDAAGHFIVDVAGWFTGTGSGAAGIDGLFVPTDPIRMLDSRNIQPYASSGMAPLNGSTLEFGTGRGASDVAAIALNITALDPWNVGYLTAYPAGLARPNTSNLNITAFNQVIANHAIVRVSTRGVALYAPAGAHMIADVAGWFLGNPAVATQPVPANNKPTPNAARQLSIPLLGKLLGVRTGSNLDAIADLGYAAAFGDQLNVAQKGNVMLFAHRTKQSAGAPLYYLDRLKPGNVFTVVGADGRNYNYLVMRLDIVKPSYTTIYNLALGVGQFTAQVVACDPRGSITNRIVATGRLISVT
jgi:sortase (surface protein transpeptidase)